TAATDCPGGTCEGGSNTGKSCTVATAATDCPGGACLPSTCTNTHFVVATGQETVCAGGTNDGNACMTSQDCPGGACTNDTYSINDPAQYHNNGTPPTLKPFRYTYSGLRVYTSTMTEPNA